MPFVRVGADTNNPLRLASQVGISDVKRFQRASVHQKIYGQRQYAPKCYNCCIDGQGVLVLTCLRTGSIQLHSTVDHLLRTILFAKFVTHPQVAAFCLLELPNDSATVIDTPCHHDFLHRTASYLIQYILRLLCS